MPTAFLHPPFPRLRCGFTLIELLVVVAIIGILAAILFPVFAKARDQGRQSTCLSNQRQLATAIALYVQDNDDCFPPSSGVWGKVAVEQKILRCPNQPDLSVIGYDYNGFLEGYRMVHVIDPTETVLTMDGIGPNDVALRRADLDARHSKAVIVSFLDGHTERRDPAKVALFFRRHIIVSPDQLMKFYNIEVVTQNVNAVTSPEAGVTCTDATQAQLNAYLPMFFEELSCYPPGVLEQRKSGYNLVQKIVLTGSIQQNGFERGGFAHYSFQTNGSRMTSWKGILVYDVTHGTTASRRGTIHHELYHLIDNFTFRPTDPANDTQWSALNGNSFAYSNDPAADGTLNDALPGFYSAYGQSTVLEDKAETYQYLMADSAHAAARCTGDPVLNAKTNLLKQRMLPLSQDIDARYWMFIEDRVPTAQ